MASYEELLSLAGENSGFVQELYEHYLRDPSLVGKRWADIFSRFSGGSSIPQALPGLPMAASEPAAALPTNGHAHSVPSVSADAELQERVIKYITAYRRHGHLRARSNPLHKGIAPLPDAADLDLSWYNFTPEELRTRVRCDGVAGHESLRLGEIVDQLPRLYCGSIGFEFTHLAHEDERRWFQNRIEARPWTMPNSEEKIVAFRKLVAAEGLESQLHKKYVGQKRFSLQGGETLIPVLDTILEACGRSGVREVVMGKAHRGRLNVLVNTLGKPITELFKEFEDQSEASILGAGDVKYHKGQKSTYLSSSGNPVEMLLAANPSHLEFVDPVVEGIVRAKQDLLYGSNRKAVVPLLMHGDAAFVGQGIVYETINLSRLGGYATGGTLHIIINNQVGFTTDPEDSRSTVYSTDMAKTVQAPVMHVNAEDVEACLWVAKLALEFRQDFGRDVVIDLVCYRKYGHNEGDDPTFTQPVVYSEVSQKKSIAHLYGEKLTADGILSADKVEAEFRSYEQSFHEAHNTKNFKVMGEACPIFGRLRIQIQATGISLDTAKRVSQTLVNFPPGFTPHPKLKTILEKRAHAVDEGIGIDWGLAETLAYGSLVIEGRDVRLSGQDSGRGTFSHRHLMLIDNEKQTKYSPLSQLTRDGNRARFEVFNSPLSEAGVLGFEYGYAFAAPASLVLWEAQFGDFANGAQVLIDQFISSCEAKWNQLSGVVMLLPHGFEGQGPEHSSARLERFLQLCSEGSMCVCYPSNAAQVFHLLRRQGLMDLKRPLVVMTPKSLLRLPEASCSLSAITSGQFEPIIEDNLSQDGSAKHVVLLTGKIYYDVVAALRKLGNPAVKVIRLEQLHPFPQFELKKALKGFKAKSVLWVQEEPKNMGAWSYLQEYIKEKVGVHIRYIGRPASASPAAGSARRHATEQKAILDEMISIVSLDRV